MSAQAAIHGRLGSDPIQRTSQSGNAWATATIAVQLSDDHEAKPTWLGLVAFGKVAEILCKHAKGDMLSASGRFKLNRWTDQDGGEREQFQIVADSIVSAKAVRPGGGRKGGGACR